jgi:membrane protease subunit (stomatin/prohibitin family)
MGASGLPVLDMLTHYREFAGNIQAQVNQKSQAFGITFSDIIIENISLPDDVEQLIDEQSGISMAKKDMGAFMQYQSARSMRDAAKQEGGLAGLGAGMALGQTMASTISDASPANKGTDFEQLKQLKALLDDGILTQEEFDLKKKQLLNL